MPPISFTLDTSHSPMGPSGPVEQSPLREKRRQSAAAFWSSDLEMKDAEVVHTLCEIEPGDPANMRL